MSPAADRTAALYARALAAGPSVHEQLQSLRALAAGRGWTVVEFVDAEASGVQESPPGLEALRSQIRSGLVDVVLCTSLGRLARSVTDLRVVVRDLSASGVDLVAQEQAIDTTVASGALFFRMFETMAQLERALLRERVASGVLRARSQGQRLGRPPKHRIDREQVRSLAEQGMTLTAIGRALGGVHPMTVKRILSALGV